MLKLWPPDSTVASPVSIGALVGSGLAPSMNAADAPMWIDGINVMARDSGMEKIPGNTILATGPAGGINDHCRGAESLINDAGVQHLFFGDTDELYNYTTSGGCISVKSGLSGADDAVGTVDALYHSFSRYGNWMLQTNGLDAAQVWKGATFAALTGVTFTKAQICLTSGPHAMVFNTDNGANYVEWAHEDDAEDWTPSASNSAGNLILRELFGPIKAAVKFGDQIAVLGLDQLILVRYIGAPFYFGYKVTLTGIGAVGKGAAIQAGRFLYGWGQAGIWRSDGVALEYIDHPAIFQYLIDNLSVAQRSKITAQYWDRTNQVVFGFPDATGEITSGITINTETGAMGLTFLPRTATVPQRNAWEHDLCIDLSGQIRCHGCGVDDGTDGINFQLLTKKFDMKSPQIWKDLQAVMTMTKRLTGTVQLRAGWAEHLDDAIAWSDKQSLDDGLEPLFFKDVAGRFLQLEFTATEVGSDVAFTGVVMYGVPAGRQF